MSQWHALTGSLDGNSYTIAYHVPIPSALNRVSINYRTAIINSGIGGKTILPDGDGTGGTISAAEKTSIGNGSILEVVEVFATNPGQTLAQLGAAVDARFAILSNAANPFLVGIQNRLAYFGGASAT
jgi:hypothetical protein